MDCSITVRGSLVVEATAQLTRIGEFILPVIKNHIWVNRAKDLIMKHPQKSPIVAKRLGMTDFSVLYVVYDEERRTCKFINQNDMKTWKLNNNDVHSLSLENLKSFLRAVGPKSHHSSFRESQTGVNSFDKLGDFSASVLLLQEPDGKLDGPDDCKVYQIPRSDLLLCAFCSDAMATCVMGDISLSLFGSKSFLGLQPVIYRNGWIPYEHNKVAHQFPVPLNKDEIKIYRKAIFRG